MKMIYLLIQSETNGYDHITEMVVSADTPAQARRLAADACGYEGVTVWKYAAITTLGQARKDMKSRVIVRATT